MLTTPRIPLLPSAWTTAAAPAPVLVLPSGEAGEAVWEKAGKAFGEGTGECIGAEGPAGEAGPVLLLRRILFSVPNVGETTPLPLPAKLPPPTPVARPSPKAASACTFLPRASPGSLC